MGHRAQRPSHRTKTPPPPRSDQHEDGYEPIYAVTGFYDGIRSGIASYRGRPHVFDSLFDEEPVGGWGTFWLMSIDDQTFAWAMEDWHIWMRFQRRRPRGFQRPPYVLPEDRPRYDVLQPLLTPRLEIDEARAFRARPQFNRPGPPMATASVAGPFEALWHPYPRHG